MVIPAKARVCLVISTRSPTGGATGGLSIGGFGVIDFYSRPHGRGDAGLVSVWVQQGQDFYSRPHGRGDGNFPQS